MSFEPFSDIPYFSKCCLRSFRLPVEEISLELIGAGCPADPVVILGLRIILDLLWLSPNSVLTKVEFSRVKLLKSCPLFQALLCSEPYLFIYKNENGKGYRCNQLC